MKCKSCNEKDGVKYSKWATGDFCSSQCAHSYGGRHGNESKKIATCLRCKDTIEIALRCSIKRAYCEDCKKILAREWQVRHTKYKKKCKFCGNEMPKGCRFVCDNCKLKYYAQYRTACSFNFDVKDYPKEFDISLIQKLGWYKATNRGNNTSGVVKDHIFSVNDGFKLGIDPEILSHPSNCRLMIQPENNRKNSKSEITLTELANRIVAFEKKHKFNKSIIKKVNYLLA